MHLPFSLASLPALPLALPSLSSLRSLQSLSFQSLSVSLDNLARLAKSFTAHPRMLAIATLFDDEQRLLNRLWVVLLGLQALLVLFGTVSAVVRGVVAMRRTSDALIPTARKGGLRRGPSQHQYPRHVTIELPATVHEYDEKVDYYYNDDYYYDDGYAEAYSNSADYDEYAYSQHYARSAPAHILNSPSQKV